MSSNFYNGSRFWETAAFGKGQQTVNGAEGGDRLISLGDGGEPDPAQTDGDEGRVYAPVEEGSEDDVLIGGAGRDKFEFHALLNAREGIIAAHTRENGSVNWRGVAGENDNVHDHWVEGWGFDTIADYSKDEGDTIVVRGHTVEIAEITYGEDDGGEFSLIRVISQQGDGGAGGANTETGAHDEDHVGFIKVYGDEVTEEDITVQAAGVFDGIDKLDRAEEVYADNNLGMTQEVFSNTDDTLYEGSVFKQTDRVHVGMGVQEVDTGGGNDFIRSYSDAGEPDPAQTEGDDGRVNPAIAPGAADDILAGGQGRDTFMFNFLLNAKAEILEKHTRSNGTINWKGVAGENDNVHDHWVEGIGTDTILDFSKQDGDKIQLRGHTVEIAGITQEEDEGGQYTLIEVRSQQGDNGGAHDEDPLGFIKVYGDVVTIEDIKVKAAGVFDGINLLDDIAEAELVAPANLEQPDLGQLQFGAENPEEISLEFTGTQFGDVIRAGSGQQLVEGGAGRDYLISYADAGEPDPAQTDGANGRINPALPDDVGNDVFVGGSGADTFEFRALLNARREVIEHHTNSSGTINWRGVAGENDNVHDHWVEGIGLDTIMDYSKEEGDKIVVRGHTVQIAEITYDEDEGGEFSLIEIYSQQGDGGAGGANTATGAHDEDPLGFIKVYGDRVEIEDIKVKAANVFDGVDRLDMVDELGDYNGGVQEFSSTTSEEIITSPASIETVDRVFIGSGAQFVDTGVGRDKIMVYADGGEPEPAQLGGDDREVPAEMSDDVIRGGQDADQFQFNFLLNATDVMMARHTREDGSINWRSVAGENDAVHDHWVENGGDDTILDYSNQDGDKIILRGHTVEIADVTQGEDEGGDYSLIHVRSQQGDGGGAHDEDSLGTIKVYGDEVTADDIKVVKKNVFDGIDIFEPIPEDEVPSLIYGSNSADSLEGTEGSDNIHGRGGKDTILGNDGDDFIFAGSSNDLVMAGEGNDWIEGGRGNDYLHGGLGDDFVVSDSGDDMMVGGDGSDHFVIENGSAGATILDWQDGQDLFDFSRMDTVESLDDLDISQMGPQMATLSFINENEDEVSVMLIGQTSFALDANDFVF